MEWLPAAKRKDPWLKLGSARQAEMSSLQSGAPMLAVEVVPIVEPKSASVKRSPARNASVTTSKAESVRVNVQGASGASTEAGFVPGTVPVPENSALPVSPNANSYQVPVLTGAALVGADASNAPAAKAANPSLRI